MRPSKYIVERDLGYVFGNRKKNGKYIIADRMVLDFIDLVEYDTWLCWIYENTRKGIDLKNMKRDLKIDDPDLQAIEDLNSANEALFHPRCEDQELIAKWLEFFKEYCEDRSFNFDATDPIQVMDLDLIITRFKDRFEEIRQILDERLTPDPNNKYDWRKTKTPPECDLRFFCAVLAGKCKSLMKSYKNELPYWVIRSDFKADLSKYEKIPEIFLDLV